MKKIESILYVEDELNTLENLSRILKRFCHKLYLARHGEEGLELYKKNTPTIVITDIKMPIMDGIELASEIKKLNEEAKIIFLTAFTEISLLEKAIEIHAEGYLHKPINLDSLEKILEKVNKSCILEKEIKEKRINEIKQKKELEKYLTIINENVITSSTDLNRRIVKVSDAFCSISGYTREELIGNKHTILRHPDTPFELYEEIYQSLRLNNIWEGEIKNRKANGEDYYIKSKIYPTFDENGEKNGYTSIIQDITYLKKVKELSIRDGLTNIYNRRFFNDIFSNYIKSAKRDNELINFMMVDVDFFKKYNDNYGHQNGDKVLIQVAKVLSESFKRGDDYTFRLGGEEFGGLFKVKDSIQSLNFANSICKKIRDLKIEHKYGIDEYVSVSIGVVSLKAKDIENKEELYKQVDGLLYKAKKSGRNKVVSNLIKGLSNG